MGIRLPNGPGGSENFVLGLAVDTTLQLVGTELGIANGRRAWKPYHPFVLQLGSHRTTARQPQRRP